MAKTSHGDNGHGGLDTEIGTIKQRIADVSKTNPREDYTRYILAFLLALSFFLLPVVIFQMTQKYNETLLSSSEKMKNPTQIQAVETSSELINPNEVLASTFGYASAPLAFMLGYYFNKSKDE